MLGENVPSLRAQQAWAAHWSAHMSGIGQPVTPEAEIEAVRARKAGTDDWLAAWAAWTATT